MVGVGVGVAPRVEVEAVVVSTMAVVLSSSLTLYRPSATVLFHFVLKLIFSENKKTLKIHNLETIGPRALAFTRRCRIIQNIFLINYSRGHTCAANLINFSKRAQAKMGKMYFSLELKISKKKFQFFSGP